jgi:hypothetical protein
MEFGEWLVSLLTFNTTTHTRVLEFRPCLPQPSNFPCPISSNQGFSFLLYFQVKAKQRVIACQLCNENMQLKNR